MVKEIDTSKLCVIVVDMQPVYLKNIKEKDRTRLIKNQLNLLDKCHEINLPVIAFEGQNPHTVHYEGTIPELREKIKQFSKNKFFEKEHNDGFTYYPQVIQQLTEWNRDTLFLTGINAYACVRETAWGAVAKGYSVITSKEMIADQHGRPNMIGAKKWFQENGIYLRNSEKLFGNL